MWASPQYLSGKTKTQPGPDLQSCQDWLGMIDKAVGGTEVRLQEDVPSTHAQS